VNFVETYFGLLCILEHNSLLQNILTHLQSPVFVEGEVPYDYSLLRQVSSLLRRLPAVDSSKFQENFLMVFAYKIHLDSP
jgi:hypothetical protein